MNTIDPKTGLPMQQPVFPPTAQQAGQAMFGTQQPGSYDRVMPSPLGKNGPIKEGLKALAYAAAGPIAPIVQVAEKLLGNKNNTTSTPPPPPPPTPPKKKTRDGHASVKSLTAQSRYNDQLRKEQADKASKKTFTKTSRKIEKVPRKKVKAVSAIKPAGIQTSATKPTASVEIKNK